MKKINRTLTPLFLVENKITTDNWFRFGKEIRDALAHEFNNKCAYCQSEVGVTSHGEVENFYPKSKFPPEIAFEWNNLLLACSVCNAAKRDKFPIDENGNPLLINPGIEDPNEHIILDKNTGLYEGITEKGKITISTLNLNRIGLVAQRKEKLFFETIAEKYPQVQSDSDNETIFKDFNDSLDKISVILTHQEGLPNLDKFIMNMLYASVITVMETYLSDIFISSIINNETYLRKFVETYPKFKKMDNDSGENIVKFSLSKIFEYYDKINERVISEILSIIYHNLKTVRPMFKDTFNVKFPNDLGDVYKAILIRHDIVHRNGRTKIDEKTKISTQHIIAKDDVLTLIEKVRYFICFINKQMEKI